MFKIFVIDLANQYNSFEFDTQDAAYDAYDKWESGGHDVFFDQMKAVDHMDKCSRMNKVIS